MGDLSSLSTSAKTSLVAALNELYGSISGAGATINDAAASTSSVYSSQKVTDLITAAVSGILDGAPAALDTLNELAAALGDDASYAASITTALGNKVDFSTPQTLSSGQKAQALSNIGAVASADVGATDTDFVAVLTAALA
jgi:hypothetical protein